VYSKHTGWVSFGVWALLVLGLLRAPEVLAAVAQTTGAQETTIPLPNQTLPAGARIYVAPMNNGFETYVVAGLHKKQVPVVVVTIREKADFELTGVSASDQAGWAKMLFLGQQSTNETASVKIVNLKSGDVVFAYAVTKVNSVSGKQSAGEAVAKHIKEKIEQK
jgi:hypothetical protein